MKEKSWKKRGETVKQNLCYSYPLSESVFLVQEQESKEMGAYAGERRRSVNFGMFMGNFSEKGPCLTTLPYFQARERCVQSNA